METVQRNKPETIRTVESVELPRGAETPEQVSDRMSRAADREVSDSVRIADEVAERVSVSSKVEIDATLRAELDRIEAEMRQARASLDLRVRPGDTMTETTERHRVEIDRALETIGRFVASSDTMPREDREKLEEEVGQALTRLSEHPSDAAEVLVSGPMKGDLFNGITNAFYGMPGGGDKERAAFLTSLFESLDGRLPEIGARIESDLESIRYIEAKAEGNRLTGEISTLAKTDPIEAIRIWNDEKSNGHFDAATVSHAINRGIESRFRELLTGGGDIASFERVLPGNFFDAVQTYYDLLGFQKKLILAERADLAPGGRASYETDQLVRESVREKIKGSPSLMLVAAVGELQRFRDESRYGSAQPLSPDFSAENLSRAIQEVARQEGRDSALANFPHVDIPDELPKEARVSMLRAYVLDRKNKGAYKMLTDLKGTDIDWQMLATKEGQVVDASVYDGLRAVRSADLQQKLWDMVAEAGVQELDPSVDGQKKYGSIPPHLIGAMRATGWATDAVVDGLRSSYAEIGRMKRGGESLKNRLEFGITNTLALIDRSQRDQFVALLGQFAGQGMDAQTTSDVFDVIAKQFFVQRGLKDLGIGNGEPQWAETNAGMTAREFIAEQRTASTKDIRALLGLDRLDIDAFERVREAWGDISSLIVIAGKYGSGFRDGMPLLKKTSEAIFDGRWEDFRYDEKDPVVARQLEGLGEDQKVAWKKNMEPRLLGDVQISAVDSEQRREQVRGQITFGLDNGHLVSYQNPETQALGLGKTYEWATNSMRGVEGYSSADLQEAKAVLGSKLFELAKLKAVASRIGMPVESLDAGAFANRLGEEIASLEALSTRNAKQENALADFRTAKRWAEERQSMGGQKVLEISNRMGLGEGSKIKDVNEMRRALEDAETIVRIGSLSSEEIAANALKDESGELKRGELTGYLKRAEERFGGTAFAQDIQNIRTILEAAGAVSGKFAGLRIEESDHPKTLFESGKYPAGSGSCQNYEGDIHYNKALLAYVADADKKIVTVRSEDGTIVARAIVKLTYVDGQQPALFLEPTYTSVNKAGHDFDADFNRYLQEKAREMGTDVKVLRGSMDGLIQTQVRASRNHVQYEDGGAGGIDAVGLGLKTGEYVMGAYDVE